MSGEQYTGPGSTSQSSFNPGGSGGGKKKNNKNGKQNAVARAYKDLTNKQIKRRIGNIDEILDPLDLDKWEKNHPAPKRKDYKTHREFLEQVFKWQQKRKTANPPNQKSTQKKIEEAGFFTPKQTAHAENLAIKYGPAGYSDAMRANLGLDQETIGYGLAPNNIHSKMMSAGTPWDDTHYTPASNRDIGSSNIGVDNNGIGSSPGNNGWGGNNNNNNKTGGIANTWTGGNAQAGNGGSNTPAEELISALGGGTPQPLTEAPNYAQVPETAGGLPGGINPLPVAQMNPAPAMGGTAQAMMQAPQTSQMNNSIAQLMASLGGTKV